MDSGRVSPTSLVYQLPAICRELEGPSDKPTSCLICPNLYAGANKLIRRPKFSQRNVSNKDAVVRPFPDGIARVIPPAVNPQAWVQGIHIKDDKKLSVVGDKG
jgi:hypothetical protein